MTRNRSARKTASGKTVSRQAYRHSAYWYARNYGYTRSDQTTFSARYLDFCGLLPEDGRNPILDRIAARNKSGRFPTLSSGLLTGYQPANACCQFNPVIFSVYLMMDIGVAVRSAVETLADPKKRKKLTEKMKKDLRILRRPFYYARETERRRQLAAARRKIVRRTTTAPMPTSEELLEAWKRRKTSKVAMVRLGGMLQDLECYVDNSLRFNGRGEVIGRNSGIRGWIREFVPELFPKYKTLMRYKAMAIKVRQATGISDPTPTSAILPEEDALEQPEKSQSTSDKEPTCAREPGHDKETARGKETNSEGAATGLEKIRIQCGNSHEGEAGAASDSSEKRDGRGNTCDGRSESAKANGAWNDGSEADGTRDGKLKEDGTRDGTLCADGGRAGSIRVSGNRETDHSRDMGESKFVREKALCRENGTENSLRKKEIAQETGLWREVAKAKVERARRELAKIISEGKGIVANGQKSFVANGRGSFVANGRGSFADLLRSLNRRVDETSVFA